MTNKEIELIYKAVSEKLNDLQSNLAILTPNTYLYVSVKKESIAYSVILEKIKYRS